MKHKIIALGLFFATLYTYAQTYDVQEITPDLYTFSSDWEVLVDVDRDDSLMGPIDLPFTFPLFEKDYSEFYISTNGFVTFVTPDFTLGEEDKNPVDFPAEPGPNAFVAGWWQDMATEIHCAEKGQISWSVQGETPNRVVVVDYANMVLLIDAILLRCQNHIDFQIHLHENGNIELHIGNNKLSGGGRSGRIGVENEKGTKAVQVPLPQGTPAQVAWRLIPAEEVVECEGTITWTGEKSSAWNDKANWDPKVVPCAEADVLIPGQIKNFPVVGEYSVESKSLTLETGGKLIYRNTNESFRFEVYGDLNIEGELVVNGSQPIFLKGTEGNLTGEGNSERTKIVLDKGARYSLKSDWYTERVEVIEEATIGLSGFTLNARELELGGWLDIENGKLIARGVEGVQIQNKSTFSRSTGTVEYQLSKDESIVPSAIYPHLTLALSTENVTIGQDGLLFIKGDLMIQPLGEEINIFTGSDWKLDNLLLGGEMADYNLFVHHAIQSSSPMKPLYLPANVTTTVYFSSVDENPFRDYLTLHCDGDFYVKGDVCKLNNGTYSNVFLEAENEVYLPAKVEINGDLVCNSGVLQNDGVASEIHLKGDLSVHGGRLNLENTDLVLDGEQDQRMDVEQAAVYNLVLDKVQGKVFLDSDLTILNSLQMSDGLINSGVFDIAVENENPEAIVYNNTESYILGNLKRKMAGANVHFGEYAFPVGDENGIKLLQIQNNGLNGEKFTNVRVHFEPHSEQNIPLRIEEGDIRYTRLDNEGYWQVTPDAQPEAGSFDLKAFWGESEYEDNYFGLVFRDEEEEWKSIPGTMAPRDGEGRLTENGYAMRKGIQQVKDVSLAMAEPNLNEQYLTANLTEFQIECKDDKVAIRWVTSQENGSGYFRLEKSLNNADFTVVGLHDAAIMSREYKEYLLEEPLLTDYMYHYRLVLIDEVGEEEIVAERSAYCDDLPLGGFTHVYQKEGSIHVEFITPVNELYELAVLDAAGKLIVMEREIAKNQAITRNLFVPQDEAMYFVRLKNSRGEKTHKIVKRP